MKLNCRTCTAVFEAVRNDAIFCSDKCRKRLSRNPSYVHPKDYPSYVHPKDYPSYVHQTKVDDTVCKYDDIVYNGDTASNNTTHNKIETYEAQFTDSPATYRREHVKTQALTGTACICSSCGEKFGSINGRCASFCKYCKTSDQRNAVEEANKEIFASIA